MSRRNTIILAVAIVVVLTVTAAILLLRRGAPPLAARLLPPADAYLYFDLQPLRTAGLFKNIVNPDPEYAQFVDDSGFQFERDLDEAAFAVHLPSAVDVGNSRTPPETRYSEVFVGRFDDAKVGAYLRKSAETSRAYHKTIIYSIPLPGRTVRVAVLSKSMVAASNADGEFVIQTIVDRYDDGGSGNEMLRRYYREVPLASAAWAMARIASAGQQGNSQFVLPGGYELFFPADTVIVAAVRYLGSVQFRADAFTRTQEDAQRVSDQLNAYLALARTIEVRAGGTVDPDLKAFFDSISVSQQENRAQLTATIPPGFVKKLVTESPSLSVTGAAPTPPPEKKKTPPRKRRR